MSLPLRVAFAGTPEFAVSALNAIHQSGHQIEVVICQPDRPAGRGRKTQACAVKQQAVELELPVYQPERLSSQEGLIHLNQYSPDVLVVVAYGQLLSRQVLEIPRLGCFNIHASLLPRWRGAAPIQRAIQHGDDQTGITIMHMVEKLDAGDIITQQTVSIGPDDTAGALHDQLARLGSQLIVEVLDQLELKHTLPAVSQDETFATYASKITKAEARINWSQSIDEVDRHIRAFNPYPVAFSYFKGKRLKVFSAEPRWCDKQSAHQTGMLQLVDNQIAVCCLNGWMLLDQIQFEGGCKMAAQAFFNAHPSLGEVLADS